VAITRVQIISVPVSDQDRALEFYVGVLGFELLYDTPMGPDMRWVQIVPKGAQTTDIERVKRAGVVIEGGIKEEFWGRYVMFEDPDGNTIILRAADAP
jgi:catechol 2,3-dioxygenase-like lactoylglutathione lyase family enzyme